MSDEFLQLPSFSFFLWCWSVVAGCCLLVFAIFKMKYLSISNWNGSTPTFGSTYESFWRDWWTENPLAHRMLEGNFFSGYVRYALCWPTKAHELNGTHQILRASWPQQEDHWIQKRATVSFVMHKFTSPVKLLILHYLLVALRIVFVWKNYSFINCFVRSVSSSEKENFG